MSVRNHLQSHSVVGGLALALALALYSPAAHANVYATNIRLNGGTNDISLSAGDSLSISYILNEPASQGVEVKILYGATVVRSILAAAGQAGTWLGANTVVWDGKNDSGASVPGGSYSVTVTAASAGYPGWTQITDDYNPGNEFWDAFGIAVDRNPSSLFYGRVFVATDAVNPNPAGNPGDNPGILKLNADGSPAEEGIFTTGDFNWAGGGYSPWKIEVSDDDYVYINDWQLSGEIYRWDPTISPGSKLHVLSPDNYPYPECSLSGVALSGSGTNTFLWMSDFGSVDLSLGILRYRLTADGTCATTDKGTSVVGFGDSLTQPPHDLALDKNGNIYTIQKLATPGDSNPRVLRFPAYDPSAHNGAPETAADWAIGAKDDTMGGASGIAVDPTGTYVAVAFQGVGDTLVNGCTQVFYASNGALVTNLDLGVVISGQVNHWDSDCAWDAVGNLYYIDRYGIQGLGGDYFSVWRAISPPGSNQATTRALQMVQVGGAPPPTGAVQIVSVQIQGQLATILFRASPEAAPSAFTVMAASLVTGPYAKVDANIRVGSTPGEFVATVQTSGGAAFYRVVQGSTPPPPSTLHISSIKVATGTVTLEFTSAVEDLPSAFTVLSAVAPTGPFSAAAGASVTATGIPGGFRATVPANGPAQFYRIRK